MTTRPTEDVSWAESAAGGDISDPAAKRTAGYLFEDPWPHEEANFMFRAVGRFLKWLANSAGGYKTVQAALAGGLADEDTFILQADPTTVRGTVTDHTALEQISGEWMDIESDGQFIVAVENGNGSFPANVTVYDPSGTTATREWLAGTVALATSVSCIACNGDYIAVGFDNANGDVYVYDYDGVQQFTFQHGAAVYDICVDNEVLILVGVAGTGAVEARSYVLSTGLSAWTYAHGATLYSVACDGSTVWIGGLVSGGNHVRSLSYTTATKILLFSQGTTNPVEGKNRIAVGENSVYILTSTGGAGQIREFEKTLSSVERANMSAGSVAAASVGPSVAADDRHLVYRNDTTFYVHPVEKTLLAANLLWSSGATNARDIISLGHSYWGHETAANGSELMEFHAGRRTQVYQYTATMSGNDRWFQRKFTPGE